MALNAGNKSAQIYLVNMWARPDLNEVLARWLHSAGGLHNLVAFADGSFGVADQNKAGGGGFHSLPAAIEELNPKSLFEIFDLLAQRRLSQIR